jgi:hypothetical protein
MVAKQSFADSFAKVQGMDISNIQNTKDIVPQVPPKKLGFRPVGTILTFTQDWGDPAKNHTMPIYRAAIENGWGALGGKA